MHLEGGIMPSGGGILPFEFEVDMTLLEDSILGTFLGSFSFRFCSSVF